MKLIEIFGISLPDSSNEFYNIANSEIGQLSVFSVIINKIVTDPNLKNDKMNVILSSFVKGDIVSAQTLDTIGCTMFADNESFHNSVLSQFKDLTKAIEKIPQLSRKNIFMKLFRDQLLNKLGGV